MPLPTRSGPSALALASLCALLYASAAVVPALAHPAHVLSAINVSAVTKADTFDAAAGRLRGGASLSGFGSPAVQASPDVVANGGHITVTWTGVTVEPGVFLGVYSPSDADPAKVSPVKYQFVSAAGGAGSLSFRLVNVRADFCVILFSGGTSAPVALARSNVVNMAVPDEMLRPRLMVTAEASEMRLLWSGPHGDAGAAQWGTESKSYTNKAAATGSTYTAADLCNAPASTTGWHDPGQINDAVMTGLVPGTRYYYTFGTSSQVGKEYSFVQPPAPGADAPIKLLAFGDMGQAAQDGSFQHYQEWPSLNTTKLMSADVASGDITSVIHIGDISYARGYATEWDFFLDQVTPLTSSVPYQISLGNHERDAPNSGSYYDGNDSGGECGVPTEAQFKTLRSSESSSYYSLNMGMVHMVFMNTELNFTRNSPQWDFLQNDLNNIDRATTPWVIFTGHRPMYIDSTNTDPPAGDQPVATLLREHVEPLLEAAKVDLAFWGHHHSYQRTCAVIGEACKAKPDSTGAYNGAWVAPVHVVIGMAGQGLSQNIKSQQPDYFEYVNDQEYGYTRVTFANSTFMSMEMVRNTDSVIRDSFSINRMA